MGSYNDFIAKTSTAENQPTEEEGEKGGAMQLLSGTERQPDVEQPQQGDSVEDYKPGIVKNMMERADTGSSAFLQGQKEVWQAAKQLALNIFADDETADSYNKEVSEDIASYNKNNPGFQVERILGSLATPLSLIPGVAHGRAVKAGFDITKTLKGRAAAATATGAGFSATTVPVEGEDFWKQKRRQVATGAIVGPAVPVLGTAGHKIYVGFKNFLSPLTKSGRQRDTANFLKEHLNENEDMIIAALNKAVAEGDDRTVGKIIADSAAAQGDDFGGMVVKLEKDLSKEFSSLKSIYARQKGSRRDIVDKIAGTDDDMAAAINKRAANGNVNYRAAFEHDVPADAALDKILKNKFGVSAQKDAMDIAEAAGPTPHMEILHNIKIGLDKQISSKGADGAPALSTAQMKAIDGVKTRLVTWMEKKNPAYKTAREVYALDSAPIDRMKVGQEIKHKLVDSLGRETPAPFASGLRNAHKTVKKSTGQSRINKLEDVLGEDEIRDLKKVSKELIVDSRAKEMAADSKSILSSLDSELSLSLPHILSRPVVITNHILKLMNQDKTLEYKMLLVDLVKNPDKFLHTYGGSSANKKTQAAVDIVRRLGVIGAAQQSAAVDI